MAEKRLNVRYASTGGREIRREMEGLGETGETAFRGIRDRAREMGQAVQDSLNRASRAMRNLGAVVSGVGAGISLALKGQIDRFDELGKAAARVGMPVEALSELEFAAQMSGASLTELETALAGLSRRAANSPADFEALGISLRDASGEMRPTRDLLADVADALAEIPPGADRVAEAQRLLGRSGADLLPMLEGGAAGLRRMTDEAAAMGRTIDGATSRAAADFNDNLTRLSANIGALWGQIAQSLLPALVEFSDRVVKLVATVQQLPPEVIEWFAKLSAALVVGGPLLLGLALALKGFAALVSPLGLIVLGIAGITAALVKFWPQIMDAKDRIQEFVADAADAFWTMKESISLAVERSVAWVQEKFTELVEWFRRLPAEMVQIGRDIIQGLADGIMERWDAVKGRVTGVFTGITDNVRELFRTRSPSLVFAEIGRDLMNGLLMGMTERGFKVEKFLADFAKRIAAQLMQTGLDRLFGAVFPSMPAPAALPSFAGGGFTGHGPRTGGMDGRGGFLAMLHPNETVIDHSRGQRREVKIRVVARSDPGVILQVASEAAAEVTREGIEAYDRHGVGQAIRRSVVDGRMIG